MRVCVLPPADLAPDSGSTLYTRLLASGLAGAGCDVTVVCARSHAALAVPAILAPIPLRHPFDHDRSIADETFAQAIAATVDAVCTRWRPRPGDLIHTVYAGYAAIAAGVVAALGGTRTVVTELGRMVNVAAPREPRYQRMAALAFRVADHVIAATSDIAGVVERDFGVAAARQTVIPVPTDLRGFTASRARDVARRPGLTVATICSCLTEEKGVTDLVEAFALARRELTTPLHLNIVGADPTPGEPFRRLVAQRLDALGIAEHVSFLGYRPHDDIPDVLAHTDVYVDARRVPNFSSVIPEAMAMRRPIVAAAVANNAALLDDGVDAVLFEPGSVAGLAAALTRLCRDAALRRALGVRGGDWLSQHADTFSVERHARQILRVYESLPPSGAVSSGRPTPRA